MEITDKTAPRRSLLFRLISAIEPKALSLDLFAGWFAWVAIIVGGGFLARQSSGQNYDLWSHLDRSWLSAFLWSIPVVLAVSLIQVTRRRGPWHVVLTTGILYLGPMTVSYVGFALLDELYHNYAPAHIARIQQTVGLVTLFFYLAGIGYLAIKARVKDDQPIAAFLVPPYIVAVLAVSLAFFQTLTCPSYRYRNAFDLTVQTAENKEGKVHIRGTFHVKEAASYVFTAVGNDPAGLSDDDLALTWNTTPPSATGDYTFDIVCKELSAKARPDPLGPADPDYIDYAHAPLVYVQISVRSDKADTPPRLVKSIPISNWQLTAYAADIK